MSKLRVPLVIVSAVHLVVAAVFAVAGAFADGGTLLEGALVSIVHPVAAVLLLIVVAPARPRGGRLRKITLALLSIDAAGLILVAALIGLGVRNGDWSLPLSLAIVPVIGIVYISSYTRRERT